MFLLLGLNHLIQYRNKQIPEYYYQEFTESVLEIVKRYQVTCIAEEFNEDCLILNHIKQSFLQEFSNSYGLQHRFIDPTLQERIRLGIASPNNEAAYTRAYRIREAWWYAHLKDLADSSVLVCIGAHHVEAFEQLLNQEAQSHEVLCSYWNEASFTRRET